jgi:hypothetical protein
MRRLDQAGRLLLAAAGEEDLLEPRPDAPPLSDARFGFHCRQAVEGLLMALLSTCGVRVAEAHSIRILLDQISDAGIPIPTAFQTLDRFAPFGAAAGSEGVPSGVTLERRHAREQVRALRRWVESHVEVIA